MYMEMHVEWVVLKVNENTKCHEKNEDSWQHCISTKC